MPRMCLVALAWNVHPRWRLVVAGNRDELHARPTAALARWADAPVLAGRDLCSGGTWMGLGPDGRVAVVTNVDWDHVDHYPDVESVRLAFGRFLHRVKEGGTVVACAEDMGDYFRVPPDGRDLNYGKFVDEGDQKLTQAEHSEDYNSHNTTRLDVDGMTRLLLKLEGMQRIARGEWDLVEEC